MQGSETKASRTRRGEVALLGFGAVLAVGLVGAFAWKPARPPPPVLADVPAFQLVDQAGAPFGSAQLQGKVWVGNFIFTRCPTICPRFTAGMRALQQKLAERDVPAHLVSFSVDPGYDTPPVLRAYAEKHGADLRSWSFLTGELAEVKRTVVDGLKVAMGRAPDAPEDDLNAIFHGEHFVLVDAKGRVRGYYASADAEKRRELLEDVALLAEEAER